MNTNIHTETILTNHNVKRNAKNKENTNVTQIYKLDFFSSNEINICNKIIEIPYFTNYYNPIIDYNYVNVGELNEHSIEEIQLVNSNRDNKYLNIEYKNIECISFDKFIVSLKTPTHFISKIFSCYTYLLNGLIVLNDYDICLFDLSPENIVYPLNNGDNPILQNFQKSIQQNKITINYIINILKSIDDYTHKPLEVHLLFYIYNNNNITLTEALMKQICKKYVDNTQVLKFFSEKYREKYYESCINVLTKYIKKPLREIVETIFESIETWDNYSLSIIYLHLIGNLTLVFSLKHKFITNFIMLLLKNISPNPLQRESLENTLSHFNHLFNGNMDWTIVKQLPTNKMKLLFAKLFA